MSNRLQWFTRISSPPGQPSANSLHAPSEEIRERRPAGDEPGPPL